jgi:hypothetical protein
VGEHSVLVLSGATAVGAGVHVDQCGVGDGLYFAAEDLGKKLITPPLPVTVYLIPARTCQS